MNITQSFYDSLASQYDTLLLASGCSEVKWLFPEVSGFYQTNVVAGK